MSHERNTGIGGLFVSKCAPCHGTSGGVSLATYADRMESGVVSAGDPDGSTVISVQLPGDHPGMFPEEELNRVVEEDREGAPE